jgi:hypothetical protein
MFSGLPLIADIDDWHLRDCGKVRGRLVGVVPTRAVRQQGAKVQRPPREKGAALAVPLSRELRHFRNDLVYTAGARRL